MNSEIEYRLQYESEQDSRSEPLRTTLSVLDTIRAEKVTCSEVQYD